MGRWRRIELKKHGSFFLNLNLKGRKNESHAAKEYGFGSVIDMILTSFLSNLATIAGKWIGGKNPLREKCGTL